MTSYLNKNEQDSLSVISPPGKHTLGLSKDVIERLYRARAERENSDSDKIDSKIESPSLFQKILHNRLEWTQLRKIHQMKLVTQMYIWLAIVPIVAKAILLAPEATTMIIPGTGLEVALTLPFSWKLFYFSAVFFVVSNIAFQLGCPRLIKSHESAAHFSKMGKSWEHLNWYATADSLSEKRYEPATGSGFEPPVEMQLSDCFWQLHALANLKRPIFRIISWVFTLLGFVLLIAVLVQGFFATMKLL